MKKTSMILCAVVLCLAMLTACGGSAMSAPEVPTATPAPSTLTGAVGEGSDASTLYLIEKGNTFTFDIAKATVTGDIVEGATVTLQYTGELDVAKEVQPVTVLGVAVEAAAASEGGMSYVTGVVSDMSSMNAIAVKADDGHVYFFDPAATAVTGGGVFADNSITITYEGTLDENTTGIQPVTVVEIETGDDTAQAAAAPSESTATKFISGRIGEDTSMNVLELQGYDGYDYTFATEDVEVTGIGLVIGNNCTVAYKGTLNPGSDMQNVIVVRIATSAFETAAQAAAESAIAQGERVTRPDNVMTGVISDESSMNDLVVNADNGTQYVLAMTGFEVTGSVLSGSRVSIHYTGDLDSGTYDVLYVVVG